MNDRKILKRWICVLSITVMSLGIFSAMPSRGDEICLAPDRPHIREYRLRVPDEALPDFIEKLRAFSEEKNYFYMPGAASAEARLDVILVSHDRAARGLNVYSEAGSTLIVGSLKYCGPGRWKSYWAELRQFLVQYYATHRDLKRPQRGGD